MASRALMEGEAGEFFVSVAIILVRSFVGLGLQLRHAEKFATTGELVLTVAVAEQAVITDPLEAAGQDMDEEAADELVGIQCHRLLLAAATIILPLEANLAIVDIEDAIVGNGDAVCVSADVFQDLLRSGEGALCIDHPFGLTDRGQVTLEGVPLPQMSQGGEKYQLTGGKCSLQSLDEEPPEQLRENLYRQEIARPAGDPLVAVRRQPAAGHNHVKMRMVQQIGPPCVENGEEPDLRTKMLRVGGDRPQSLGYRTEQNAVDDRLVLQGNGRQLGWQGEHHVEVLRVENLGTAVIQPLSASQ